MFGNLGTSLVRTGTPMLVAWLLALPIAPAVLSALGIDTERATTILAPLVGFVLAFAWYWLVRLLEGKWAWFGVLLGKPAKPTYSSGSLLDG